jgi:hypothetical protein
MELLYFEIKGFLLNGVLLVENCKSRIQMTLKIKRTLPILLLASLASIALIMGAIGADYTVLDAAKDLGNLNTFSAAIQKAGAVGTLNNEGVHISNNTFVVFAPMIRHSRTCQQERWMHCMQTMATYRIC